MLANRTTCPGDLQVPRQCPILTPAPLHPKAHCPSQPQPRAPGLAVTAEARALWESLGLGAPLAGLTQAPLRVLTSSLLQAMLLMEINCFQQCLFPNHHRFLCFPSSLPSGLLWAMDGTLSAQTRLFKAGPWLGQPMASGRGQWGAWRSLPVLPEETAPDVAPHKVSSVVKRGWPPTVSLQAWREALCPTSHGPAQTRLCLGVRRARGAHVALPANVS